MRAVGVMGGTFDPIHHGHLVAASEVADEYELDRVIFVPTGRPWQKDSLGAGAEHRYLMTVIGTATDPRFDVSRVDIDRPGPTYTIDTLQDLRRQLGDQVRLVFITGADALGQILTWHRHEEAIALAEFVGVSRPGFNLDAPIPVAPTPGARVSLMEVPALAISSTDVRDRVAAGRSIDYLVPEGVARFIEKLGLYAGADR